MTTKCKLCKNELFEDENGDLFCPDCEADKFLTTFDENDDSWLNSKFKTVKPKTKPVTLRMNINDIEKAKKIAKLSNMPYQKLLKDIIHENLSKEAG